MPFAPSKADSDERSRVLRNVLAAIEGDERIRLPEGTTGVSDFALEAMCRASGRYSGQIGQFGFLFEGEDDLLHLMIVRLDDEPPAAEDARELAAFLLDGVPAGLVWHNPGKLSHHFYVGHDVLPGSVRT